MSNSQLKTSVKTEKHGTETHGTILALLGPKKKEIGRLRFVDYDGTTQIRLIYVEPGHRRKGVATTLVAALRKRLPESRPAQFLMNPDGRAFRNAVFDRYARPRR